MDLSQNPNRITFNLKFNLQSFQVVKSSLTLDPEGCSKTRSYQNKNNYLELFVLFLKIRLCLVGGKPNTSIVPLEV